MIGTYVCDTGALGERLRSHFVELAPDAEALGFEERWSDAPHGRLASSLHRALRRLVTDFDAAGLLGMYPMHLLSSEQFLKLLGEAMVQRGGRLLDVGAGDGTITARAAPLFSEVVATEVSPFMRRRLAQRGFRVERWDLSRRPLSERFDAILCLNVLDRCQRPLSLLEHLSNGLTPGGALVVSVPLPLRPHVDVGSRTVDPDEPLPAPAATWEAGAEQLYREVLEPAALAVRSLSRAPYLCRGDARRPLSALDAAVFVCERASG